MNFLQGLVNAAEQKKKQLGNIIHNDVVAPVQRDVIAPVSHAGGNVVNALSAHNTIAPLGRVISNDVWQPLNRDVFRPSVDLIEQRNPGFAPAMHTLGAVGARTGIGFGQAGSGLYDMLHQHTLSPKPTSFDNILNQAGVNVDTYAKQNHVNPVLYRGGQIAANLIPVGLGGDLVKGTAKVAEELPRVGGAVRTVANAVERAPKVVERATKGLYDSGAKGRIAAKTIRGTLNPSLAANNAAFQAYNVGQEAGHGQRINPLEQAASFAAFQAGAPLAGAVGREGVALGVKGAKDTAKYLQSISDAQAAHVTGLHPDRVIHDNEANTLRDFADYLTKDYQPDAPTTNQLIHNARQSAESAGVDVTSGTPQEVVDRIYNYLSQRNQFLKAKDSFAQGGKALVSEDGSTIPTIKKLAGKSNPVPDTNGKAMSIDKPKKPSVAPEVQPKTYNTVHQGGVIKPVEGTSVDLVKGVKTFIHKDENGNWVVSEASTGRSLTSGGYPNQAHALKEARDNIMNVGEAKFKQALKDKQLSPQPTQAAKNTAVDAASKPTKQSPHAAAPAKPKTSIVKASSAKNTPASSLKDKVASLPKAAPMSKAIKKAEDDYIAGKISAGQLEKLRNAETKLPTGQKLALPTDNYAKLKGSKPTKNFSSTQYVKEQTAAQKTAQDIGNPNTAIAKLNALKADAKRKLVDSYAPIEDTLNKAVKNGANIRPTNNIKYQIDRVLRADTIAGQYMKDNGLAKIVQKVKPEEFDQYLIARHAADVEKNGVKTGRDIVKDQQLVKALDGKYKAQADAIGKYSRDLLDKSADYGLISKDLATALKQRYPNYVPLKRVFSEIEQAGIKGNGKGVSSISTQSIVQRLKGSDREIASPLNSIIEKTNDVIEQGERNKAASMLASYKDLEGNPFNLKELKSTETIGTRPTISYFDNGKLRRFETSKEIADAAKNLNKEQIGFIGQIFAVPTRILRLGATGVNVGFTLANVTKDIASGFINSEHGYTMADPGAFVAALKAATMHGSKEYGELVREGAGGTSFDIARNAAKKNLKALRANRNKATQIAYTVTRPAQLLRAVENTIGRGEEFGRALQYYGNKNAFARKGFSPEEARTLGANAARSNTVNFARAGDYGRAANMLLPYLNAGVQGSRTLLRNIKDRPIQTGAKIALTAFTPMAAVTAWNLSDPKRRAAYNEIQDYEKEGNFILLPPNPKKDPKTGRWNAIKIPMSQEIANLNNVVRNGVEALSKDKKFDFAKMTGSLLGTTTSINADNGRQAIGQFVPQAIKPGVETITNTNLFTGNQIVPDKLRNLDKRDQVGNYTSGTAKLLGSLTRQSPLVVDNAIRTGAGGTGQNIVHATDSLLAKTGYIKPDQVQGKNLVASVTDRFNGAQSISDYQVADKKVQAKLADMRNLPAFKAMSTDDKAKALNRLESGARNAFYNPKDKKVSSRDAGLRDGSTSVKDYLQTKGNGVSIASGISNNSKDLLTKYNAMNTDDRNKLAYSQNDWDYKVAQAKYENDKATGKLSITGNIKAQDALRKDKVGSAYSKDTRDLYSLSKSDIYNYLSTPEKGVDKQKLANDLIAYDNALHNAGLTSYLKFKTGIAPSVARGSSKSSGGSKAKLTPSDFKSPYTASIQSSSKGAQLARNAKLVKANQVAIKSMKAPAKKALPTLKKKAFA